MGFSQRYLARLNVEWRSILLFASSFFLAGISIFAIAALSSGGILALLTQIAFGIPIWVALIAIAASIIHGIGRLLLCLLDSAKARIALSSLAIGAVWLTSSHIAAYPLDFPEWVSGSMLYISAYLFALTATFVSVDLFNFLPKTRFWNRWFFVQDSHHPQ